jgi:hypothetical protein
MIASCFHTDGSPAVISGGDGTMDLALSDHARSVWHDRFALNVIGDGGAFPPPCGCGTNGQECCEGAYCGDRTVTFLQCEVTNGIETTQTCQPCGDYDQPACWGQSCKPGQWLTVSAAGDGFCGPECGSGIGAPCCPFDNQNLDQGCGNPSQTLLRCGPSTQWPTGQCTECGHPGEPCCVSWEYVGVIGGICQSGSSCHAAGSGAPICTLDGPSGCGKLFEPCCAGTCQAGEGTCSNGYCVVPPGPTPGIEADLQPGAPLAFSPTIIHADEAFTVSWLTCNRGTDKAEAFSDAVWLDGDQVDVELQDALYPGQCGNASFTFVDGLSLGHHQIIVYEDMFNMVEELNEDNNSQEQDIFVQ